MSIDILPEDVTVEPYPSRREGGQHVGVGPNGIKITHEASGLIAISDADRSQHRNRAIAMDMLLGGLTSPHYRGSR